MRAQRNKSNIGSGSGIMVDHDQEGGTRMSVYLTADSGRSRDRLLRGSFRLRSPPKADICRLAHLWEFRF